MLIIADRSTQLENSRLDQRPISALFRLFIEEAIEDNDRRRAPRATASSRFDNSRRNSRERPGDSRFIEALLNYRLDCWPPTLLVRVAF